MSTTSRLSTKMTVPLLDLKAQYASLSGDLSVAIDRVMESQYFILGPEGAQFEREIEKYTGVRHAIGCASCSDALLLALMALGIGEGDEVITSPYSFFATASSITRLGARPVFVDIDPRTYNIDVTRVEAAITERTRAIMPVHLYGQVADMSALKELSSAHKLPIVEDAAQAIGARDESGNAGAIGTIGCFSFYPSKNLGGAGDGGLLTTNDDDIADILRVLRAHGGEHRYYHRVVGINSRLDELQAAILRVKLPHLDSWSDARAAHAARYNELFEAAGLGHRVEVPFSKAGARHIYHQYVVRVERRDALLESLKAYDIGCDIYYPVPLHLQECFAYLGYAEGDYPESERASRETLALPVYPEISEEQQRYVVDVIRRFYLGDNV